MRRYQIVLGVGVVAAALMWWSRDSESTDDDDGPSAGGGSAAQSDPARTGNVGSAITKGRTGTWSGITHTDGAVTIAGRVIDESATGVTGVEVVFRGEDGEQSVLSTVDGAYRIEVQPGTYRAFVRDEHALSVGRTGRIRLPSNPDADAIGMPDETAMTLVVANHDASHVDLKVALAAAITGHVYDGAGNPVAHAVVRALGAVKPVLGTDTVETDAEGNFTLMVPPGAWHLDATHPRFAGLMSATSVYVTRDGRTQDLILAAGCVISGRVLAANGMPAGEGALEKRWGTTDTEFGPNGTIAADGTFRWVTTELTDVTLRAWPWKSPPSQSQSFACRDGARFSNVVFQIPTRGADIEGTLADLSGAPVALAYVDLAPLDPGGIAQQERSDADGKWAVFQMPAGRYRVTAYAQGRGVVSTIVTSPQTGVRLALGGTGSLTGTTQQIEDGSFSLQLVSCTLDGAAVAIPDEARVVSVVAGKFVIDELPACNLKVFALWESARLAFQIDIPHRGTATKELAFGAESAPPPPDDEPDRPANEPDEPDEPDEADSPEVDLGSDEPDPIRAPDRIIYNF